MNSANIRENSSLSSQWDTAWRAIAQRRFWTFLLTAIGSASSLIYPHPPLVGFAVVAGTTLNRRGAIIAAFDIWMANQIFGYAIRHYPLTSESLTWGLVMGLGTILATLIASIRPQFSRHQFTGHSLWLFAAVVVGFTIFEGLILFVGQWQFGGLHDMTLAIFWPILVREMGCAIALTSLHSILVWRAVKLSVPPLFSESHTSP